MQTIELKDASTIEIISAYAASNQPVDAVAETPGWHVAGAFRMAVSAPAQLQLVGSVSMVGLTMRARLFDITAAAPVGGSTAEIAVTVDARAVSGEVDLVGGHIYQMQVEVTGVSDADPENPIDGFGTVKEASLV